jgi:hypothetical protein
MAALVTNAGLDILASRVKGLGTEPLYLAWGTGITAPVVGDTDLDTEDTTGGYARVAAVSSIVTIVAADDTYQISGALAAQAALVITEWGVFDAAAAGNLLLREVQQPGFSLSAGGIVNFLFKLQMSRCS